jgi:hypothetical protein
VQAEENEKNDVLLQKVGGSKVHLLLGIKNTNLDPVLVKVLPPGIAVYMSPFKDIFGSRRIFAGPYKSFSKADNGKKSEMSNAVVLIRERIFEELQTETEERCYSIRTNERLGLSVNPYPINRDDILDCGGEIIEDLEDSLDEHDKLLEILDDQEILCKLHSAHGMVKTFRCLIIDQEVSLNQLEYKLTEGMQINGDLMEQEEKDLSREFGGFCGGASFS